MPTLAEALMQFGYDPSITDRPAILPDYRPGVGFVAPEMAVGLAKALMLPGHAMKGGEYTYGDATDAALNIGGIGGAIGAAAAPRGAMAMGAAKGKLPMDEASRMARADEMGFNTIRELYHLTGGDFDAFKLNANPASHTGGGAIWLRPNPKSHSSTHNTGGAGTDIYAQGVNDLPVFARLQKEIPVDVYSRMKRDGDLNASFPIRVTMDENKRMREMGYTHAEVPGEHMGEVVVFDPSNIRSRFAKFDPAKKDSADLLAANASPILSSLLMTLPQGNE